MLTFDLTVDLKAKLDKIAQIIHDEDRLWNTCTWLQSSIKMNLTITHFLLILQFLS